jgi:spermidine synthase
MEPIKAVMEYDELDHEMSIERTYLYHKMNSICIYTDKQVVDIINSPYWGKMLFLDGTLQSTTRDEIIYHNALVHPLLHSLRDTNSILILGGGEGATAREILRWNVSDVTMVDYDKELVEYMKLKIKDWAMGAFNDSRLHVRYEDAWKFMLANNTNYNGVVIDLTDPKISKEEWSLLLTLVMKSINENKGGFVMNAGAYIPWKIQDLRKIVSIIKKLCRNNQDYNCYVYTTYVPSFNSEWTFIVVLHKSRNMLDPATLDIIPAWIRRGIHMLDDTILNECIYLYPCIDKIYRTNT